MTYKTLQQKLKDLALLKPDWDSYGSVVPEASAIDAAGYMLKYSRQYLLPTYIVADVEGGVSLGWDNDHRHAYTTFCNDGDIILVYYRGMMEEPVVVASQFDFNYLHEMLKKIQDFMQEPNTVAEKQ